MSHRRICIRPRQGSLSFLQVSPTKRCKIRKRRVKLTSARSLPKPTSSAPNDESQERIEPAHCGGEQDQGSERDSSEHDVELHMESGSEDEQDVQMSTYRKRQQKSTSAWMGVRKLLHRAKIESSVPSVNGACVVCNSPAVIVCYDCGSEGRYCESCTESVHSRQNIFHKPQIWKVLH